MSQSLQPVEGDTNYQSEQMNYNANNTDSLLDKSSHVMELINDGVLINYCTAPPGSKEWNDYQIQRVVAMRKLKIKSVEFQAKANQDLRKLMGDVIEDPHIPDLIDSSEDLPSPMANGTSTTLKKTHKQEMTIHSKDLNANVTWKEPIADTRVMSLHVITQGPSKSDPQKSVTKVLKLKNGRKTRGKLIPTAISKTSGKISHSRNTISTNAKSSKAKSKMQVIAGNKTDISKMISDVTGRNLRTQESDILNKAKTINTFVSTLKTLKTTPVQERSRNPSIKTFPLLEAFTDISLCDDENSFHNKLQQTLLENRNYANQKQVQLAVNTTNTNDSNSNPVGLMQYGDFDLTQDQVELSKLLPALPNDPNNKNRPGRLSTAYIRSINNTMADATNGNIKSSLSSTLSTTYARLTTQMQTQKVDGLSLSPIESNASGSKISVGIEDYNENDNIATQLSASNVNIPNKNGFSGATSTASVSRWENFQSRAKYLTMEYEALESLLARIKPPELPDLEVCDALPGTARWQTYWENFNKRIGDYYSSVEKYSNQMDNLLTDEDGKQYTDELRKRYFNETALKVGMGLPRRPPLIRLPLRETVDIGGYVIRPLGGPVSGAFVTTYDHTSFRLEIQVDKLDNELENINTDTKLNIMTITIPSNGKGNLFKKLIQITVPKYKRVQSLRIGNPLYNAGKIIVTGV